MIRALVTAVALGALGCAAAPPPAPTAPAPPSAKPAPEAAPPPAETPDEVLRYRPLPLDPAPAWTPPRATEARWPGGARLLVVERRGLPLVELQVDLRREARAPIPGLDVVCLSMVFHSALDRAAGDRTLLDALKALGMRVRFSLGPDAVTVRITGPAAGAAEALSLLTGALARFEPTEAALARTQGEMSRSFDGQKPSEETRRARIFRVADAQILPAGHRYLAERTTSAAVARVKLADVVQQKPRTVAPDRLRIVVAGDVSPDALRAAADPALRAWKAPPARSPAVVAPSARAFLIEETGPENAELLIAWPAAPLDASSADAWGLARTALHTTVFDRLKAEPGLVWTAGHVGTVERREAPLDYVVVTVEPASLAKVARVVLDALERAAKGEIADADIEEARQSHLRFLEGEHTSNVGVAKLAAIGLLRDMPPDAQRRRYERLQKASRADVQAAARAWLVRKETRLFALGGVTGSKAEVEALGLGKATVVGASR